MLNLLRIALLPITRTFIRPYQGVGLFFVYFPALLLAQTLPDERYWITDGTINSIVNSGSSIYIGGDFGYIGPNTGVAAAINASDDSTSNNFPLIDRYDSDGNPIGEVFTAIPDGNDGWFVGGSFLIVSGEDRPYLIHINANLTINSDFNLRPNGPVHALALSNDGTTLYVGGEFTNISANAKQRLAAITLPDEENDIDLALQTWAPSIDDGRVNSLAVSSDDSTIYVGGTFNSLNGEAGIHSITALDTTSGNRLSAWAPSDSATNAGGFVNSLSLSLSDPPVLYIGGAFSDVGILPRANLAALDPANGTPTSWDPGTDGEIKSIYRNTKNNDDARVYIGGDFNNVAGVQQAYLARITIDTDTNNLDTDWTPSVDGSINSLYLDDIRNNASNNLYFAGNFTEAAGHGSTEFRSRYNIARLNDTGTLATWAPISNSTVNALALNNKGTNILAGGDMTSIGGIMQANFAELEISNGAINEEWLPQVDGPVNAMALNEDFSFLYLAGDFSQIDNSPRDKLARFVTFNNQLDDWAPSIENGQVTTITLAELGSLVKSVTVDPNNSNRLYAATDNGLYTSNNAGNEWYLSTTLEPKVIRKIIVDPNNSNTVYVTAGSDGIFRSTDGGISWTPINTGLTNLSVRDFAITGDSSRIYLATEILSQTEGGVYVSENQGTSWTLIARSNTNAIAFAANDNNQVYLGTEQGFFILERHIPDDETEYTHTPVDCITSTENSIDPCNIGLDSSANVTYIHISTEPGLEDEDTIIYAISNGILFRSINNAQEWTALIERGIPRTSSVSGITSHPDTPHILYTSTINGGVFKSTDSGLSWNTANNQLSNLLTVSITVDPQDSDTLYSTATIGFIHKTTNAADNWFDAHTGIPNNILYIGGDFFGSHPEFLAAIDTTSSNNTFLDWNTLSNNTVNALALSSDNATLYVGGKFSAIGGQNLDHIAALDRSTGVALDWAPNVNGEVHTLDLSSDDRTLYIGGDFTTPNNFLAALDTEDESAISTWTPSISTTVDTAHVSNLKLFNSDHLMIISGNFDQVDGQNRQYLATLTTSPDDTTHVTNWLLDPNALPTSGHHALNAKGSLVFVGGNFTRINSTTRQSFAAYSFKAPEISASPLSGTYTNAFLATLSCSQDIGECDTNNIRYTTNEDLETATWTPYNDTPILITESTPLSAYSIDDEGFRSEITTVNYTIDSDAPTVDIDLPSGKYTYTHTSDLICDDGDEEADDVSGCNSIFYTLDGSDPTFVTRTTINDNRALNTFAESGTTVKYTEDTPVPIRVNSTLRVIAVDAAGNISREIVGVYEIERGKGSGSLSGLLLSLLFLITAFRLATQSKNSNSAKEHKTRRLRTQRIQNQI